MENGSDIKPWSTWLGRALGCVVLTGVTKWVESSIWLIWCIKCKTLHIPDVMTSCPRTCERNLHGEQNAEMHKVIHEPLKLHGAVCIFVLDWFRLLRLIFCHLPFKIVIFYTCVSYIVHHVSSHISWKSQGRTRISIIRGCHYQHNYQW